ncbi:MAG: hypothetical protein KDK45_03665 [Leptospiraceae bacterium]|nr:hypothetical protein [Leptospiraceae bacterium]
MKKNWDCQKKHPVIKISFSGGIMQTPKQVEEIIQGILRYNQRNLNISCKKELSSSILFERIN